MNRPFNLNPNFNFDPRLVPDPFSTSEVYREYVRNIQNNPLVVLARETEAKKKLAEKLEQEKLNRQIKKLSKK